MEQATKNLQRLQELHQGEARAKSQEEANLLVDFDEALEEHRKAQTPQRVRFGGRTYDVPATMPAPFTFFYLRNCIKPQATGGFQFAIEDQHLETFFRLCLGKELADAVATTEGVSLEFVLETMVAQILAGWGLGIRPGQDGQLEKKTGTTPG